MIDTARVESLEASGRAALPALHERELDGWLLRVSGGDTKRVNSVNPLPQAGPVDRVRAAAEPLYSASGLPCRFRLTPLAPADADPALAAAGYLIVDPSWTMVAPLTAREVDTSVRIAAATPAAILLAEQLATRSPPAAAVQARLLPAIPGLIALASIERDGAPVASGYASIGEGRAQLSDIVVAPDARGQGHGRRLVAALLGWAYAQGCREAMLQVLGTNVVARGLYRSFGFTDAYAYHYRVQAISAAT